MKKLLFVIFIMIFTFKAFSQNLDTLPDESNYLSPKQILKDEAVKTSMPSSFGVGLGYANASGSFFLGRYSRIDNLDGLSFNVNGFHSFKDISIGMNIIFSFLNLNNSSMSLLTLNPAIRSYNDLGGSNLVVQFGGLFSYHDIPYQSTAFGINFGAGFAFGKTASFEILPILNCLFYDKESPSILLLLNIGLSLGV
jgi:hypothetical protein